MENHSSLQDNPMQHYKRAYQIFDVQSNSVYIWDFSGQMTQFVGDGENCPNDCLGQATEEALLELQVYGLPNMDKDTVARKPETAMNGTFRSRHSDSNLSIHMNDTVESQSSSEPFLGPQSSSRRYGETEVLGLTGLQNLGNTCFMNSAIQCLAHTPKLIDYFLGDFKREINYENPLGVNGKLALAFGDLLRRLWAPGGMAVVPTLFKSTLEGFAPQFYGYNQHDSQEFLAFLLNGLHEDLNRVKHKLYTQIGYTEGIPDQQMADEYWQIHLARNDSIIVDLCHGQFRSKLVCPVCRRVSVTFDPFMYLSLPLPSTTMRTMTVTLLSTDGSMPPSQLTVTVPKCGRCKDLIQALSTACSLQDDETLFVAEVYNHFILRYLEDPSDSLALIRDHDCLVAYRLPKESENSQLVVFMHQERNLGFRCLFGIPLVTRISGISDGLQIHNAYMKLLRPFLNTDEDGSDDTGNSDYELAKMETILSNLDDLSSSDDELEHYSDFLFRFTNERGIEGQRINLKKPLDLSDTGSKLHVLVSWPEQMVRRYDTSRLSLLPEVFEPGISAIKPQESVSLSKCLEGFLKEEPLGPDDMWYCPSCKQHRQASKKLDLWRLPEILIVHLKRFSYSQLLRDKLETFVDFPLDELDLTGFLSHDSDPSLNHYRLYAISNHFGSMGSGHYTALIYHGKSWYEFNDSLVEPLKEEDVKTSAAYVLFYRRISGT
ncbi:ubiquitin carboxyl-terminal hydrolase 8-like isoform X2 [Amaranthus tricolor]|uniref:ubiquitin carboxyl-terminal hydrolase 8-like isoform X2 n=1 Tax=Amaranthus tricolor TaxID=29722 RepID=UPI00258E91C5|nr:ubiquitin carboxyl-terminal hydrolase 8-like isoform X2 [Amaranthus tricolor]XP_057523845.1 ubiquitin carboxyl-terminal hydrolase 8-like isoform X2 [Amaranthus tricolor]XP_057523846.1 ubiquitin carboxyl-terminal hydrolase 8-like isoform X2 [Amaranthus tricolor]